jgi:hypothetical protein
MAQRRRAIGQLSKILSATDRERQATGDFTGLQCDAALALLLLTGQSGGRLSSKQRAGLALLVHHGGSAHDLRSAKHALAKPRVADDHILLYRQISDRIQIMHGRPQIYGTQWRVNRETGATAPFPVRSVRRGWA